MPTLTQAHVMLIDATIDALIADASLFDAFERFGEALEAAGLGSISCITDYGASYVIGGERYDVVEGGRDGFMLSPA